MIEIVGLLLTLAVVAGGRWLTRPRWPVGSWLLINGEAQWVTHFDDRTHTLTVTPAAGVAFASDAVAEFPQPMFVRR